MAAWCRLGIRRWPFPFFVGHNAWHLPSDDAVSERPSLRNQTHKFGSRESRIPRNVPVLRILRNIVPEPLRLSGQSSLAAFFCPRIGQLLTQLSHSYPFGTQAILQDPFYPYSDILCNMSERMPL